MRRLLVKSRNLSEVGYDPIDGTLEVIFRAAPRWIYTYRNVTPKKFVGLITAPSIGSYFHREIRSRQKQHPYTRRKVR